MLGTLKYATSEQQLDNYTFSVLLLKNPIWNTASVALE